MWKYIPVALVAASVSIFTYSYARPQATSPGLEPFTPTRMDWLSTTLEANLHEIVMGNGYNFALDVVATDPETITIRVEYTSNVDRKIMNEHIDDARQAIQIAAKGYGWDSWVKTREDIRLTK